MYGRTVGIVSPRRISRAGGAIAWANWCRSTARSTPGLRIAARRVFGEDRRVAVSHEVRWPAHGVRRGDGGGLGPLLTFVDDATSRFMQIACSPTRRPRHPARG